MKDFSNPPVRYNPSATQDPGDPRLIPTSYTHRSRQRLLVAAGVVAALGLLVAGGVLMGVFSAVEATTERFREQADEKHYVAVIAPIVGILELQQQLQQQMIGYGLRTRQYSMSQWRYHIESQLEGAWVTEYEKPSALVCAQAPGKGLRIRLPFSIAGNLTTSEMQLLQERIRTAINALFEDPNAPANYRSVFAVSVDTQMREGATADGQYLHLCVGR